MNDITAILIHYRTQSTLDKAIRSLHQLGERLISILVYQEKQAKFDCKYREDQHIHFIPIENEDLGEMINDTMSRLTSSYVLFLSNPAYLAANVADHVLRTKRPLRTGVFYRNQIQELPLVIPQAYLLNRPLLPRTHLPFKEAMLPAWLFQEDLNLWDWRTNLIKYQQMNTSPDTVQKNRFLYKYQLSKETVTNHSSVSIVIANYNMENYLETALRSCFLQTVPPEEVLVIDDGSTDQSYRLLKQWNRRRNIRIFHKQNGGKARALNFLLPHITSDFVLELDADDWLDPDAIKRAKTYLDDLTENTSLLYGNLRKWKQLEDEKDIMYKTTSQGMEVKNWNQLKRYPFPLGPRIYRTSLLKEHGGFPVLEFAEGRLYEDVSVLKKLIGDTQFCYRDFTVYNVREHKQSITKQYQETWNKFIEASKKEEEKDNRG